MAAFHDSGLGTMAASRAAWAAVSLLAGTLKFRWADASGEWEKAAVNDVVRIEIAR